MSSYWLKPLKQLSLALLLAWLLCLSVFAQQTEDLTKQQKQEPPSKIILDAPSLSIKAQPYYKTTVKELGYESVDDLLKQSVQTQKYVLAVAFGGGVLASGSDDGTVKLWNVQSGNLIKTLQTQRAVTSVAFDGGVLALESDDGTVKLWNVQSGELINTLQAQSRINAMAFDGNVLASGSPDGTVKLWNVQSGNLIKTLQTQSAIFSVAFDGGVLASGLSDGTVKLWNVQSGKLIHTALAASDGTWVTIKADGSILRADAGKLLRKESVLAENQYRVSEPERNKDGKLTGKTHTTQQTYRSSEWHYLGFPSSTTTALEPSLEQTNIELAANKTVLITVQLSNTGTEPIFYPHLIETTSADGSLKLISAEYWPTYPQTEAIPSSSTVIPAGNSIQLAARLVAQTAKAGTYKLPLKIAVSGGQFKEVELTVKLQQAVIEVKESDYSFSTHSVVVRLHNADSSAFPTTQAYLVDVTGQIVSNSQTVDSLAPNTDALSLAFQLNEQVAWWQLPRLKLAINPNQPSNYLNTHVPTQLYSLWLLAGIASLGAATVLLGGYYLRRHHRHPLVVSLSENPQQLRSIPLEQLAEAQQRLQNTGHLTNVLENAEVSVQTFQQALGFAHLTSEQKAQLIAKRLNAKIIEQLAPDLWMLKLPDSFILNLNRFLLYFPTVAAEDAFNALYATPQAEGRVRVIIGSDAAYQRKLLNTSQDRSNKYVAPQSKQLTELLLSPQAEPIFAKILAEQLSLQKLSPYKSTGGVKKEAIFFGRRELIAQIINRDPSNYLIVGGRQMGKSSLLKALERRYAENAQVRVYYQTLSNETLIPRLAAALDLPATESPQAFAQALEAQLKAEGKCYIFLIDEADFFIAHEQAQGYPILSVFRRLSEQGQCSFILAGFWQLYQHTVLDYQSPLRNFGEVLEVGALEQDACEQLATKPMQNLNLSYANHALVPHLISQCGQRASLIADVCDQVIKQLNASQRVIEAGDLHRVLEGRDLQKYLAGWSVGIGEAEQAYDRLVVYSTIKKDGFTLGELMQDLEGERVRFNSTELERALSRLELAFVLKKDKNHYSYCVPLFVNYMREDEVEVKRVRELKAWR